MSREYFQRIVSPLFTAMRRYGSPRLLWFLFRLFIAGIILLLAARAAVLHGTIWSEIVRDLGIALCISVVVALIIEVSLSRKIFLRGLDAIMERTVPDEVWQDFRQHVISQQLMRENWTLTMNIRELQDRRLASRTTVSYVIVSLQDALATDVFHELDSHRSLPGADHRFLRATIGRDHYGDPAQLLGEKLLSEDGLTLRVLVNLKKYGDRSPVELEFEERLTCPDTIVWWMGRVTKNITIVVKGVPEAMCVGVKTFHPAQGQLEQIADQTWQFTGIMLPGQGVEIRVRRTG